MLQWFPYHENEKITFKNANNNTEFITINQVSKSEPEEINVGGFGNNRTCNASYAVSSQELDTAYVPRFQIFSNIYYNSSNNEESRNTQLIFFRERFDASKIVDTGFVLPLNTASHISTLFFNTLTLNNITFQKVQVLKIDTTLIKPFKIRSVYISKNNGIIGYVRYPSNELWVKQ